MSIDGQRELSENFGIVSEDTGYSSHKSETGVGVKIDRSSNNAGATITLPAGGSIVCDEGLIAGNLPDGVDVETGIFNLSAWGNWISRGLSGENIFQKTYVNNSNEPVEVTLRLENTNLYAVDLSKIPEGAIMADRGAFKASVSGSDGAHANQGWTFWPGLNLFAGDTALRQQVSGSNIVLMEAGEALSIQNIDPGSKNNISASNYVASSANVDRGLGLRLKHWFMRTLGYEDDIAFMKMYNNSPDAGIVITSSSKPSSTGPSPA